MDKEVRAVFLCLFTYLLGDYQNYVTVIRFKPPSFYFNTVSALVYDSVGVRVFMCVSQCVGVSVCSSIL